MTPPTVPPAIAPVLDEELDMLCEGVTLATLEEVLGILIEPGVVEEEVLLMTLEMV